MVPPGWCVWCFGRCATLGQAGYLSPIAGTVRAVCGWGGMCVHFSPQACSCVVGSRLRSLSCIASVPALFMAVGLGSAQGACYCSEPSCSGLWARHQYHFLWRICVCICLQRVSFGPHSTPPCTPHQQHCDACVFIPPVNCRSCVVCWGYCTPAMDPINMRCALFVLCFLLAVLAALMLQAAGGPGGMAVSGGTFLTVC